MSVTRHQLRIALVVGVVIGLVAVPVVGSVLQGMIPVSGSVPLETNDGPTVTVDAANYLNDSEYIDDQTVAVRTDFGNATFTSSARTEASVQADQITGAWTNLTAVNVTSSSLTADPEDKANISITGEATAVAWQDYAADNNAVDAVIEGNGGQSQITFYGLQSGATYTAEDGDGKPWGVVDASASGAVTFTIEHSTAQVILKSGDTTDPAQQSDPDPTGLLSHNPTELNVTITDADFPRDSVDVTVSVDGSQVNTKTVSSNGSVSFSMPSAGQTGGSHSWTVDTTDDFSNTQSNSYSYTAPSKLYIKNETNGQLLDTVNVELHFYSQESEDTATIETRTATNGVIDLTGLPVAEPIVAIASANNHYDRRITIRSIYDQEALYLLNNTIQTARPTFVVNDYTGDFPSSTTILEVQRSINDSYKTV